MGFSPTIVATELILYTRESYTCNSFGLTIVATEPRDIVVVAMFHQACKRNNAHGLALRRDERNEAIVKLCKDGYKQKTLAEMWGVHKGQISRIVGAEERTEKVASRNSNQKITPAHEQIIRRAPEEYQDKVAEVVLTRKNAEGKDRPLRVTETNTLVKLVSEKDGIEAQEVLGKLQENLTMRVVGTDDNGDVDAESISEVIQSVKSAPDMESDWYALMAKLQAQGLSLKDKTKITPAHEEIIRRAPDEYQAFNTRRRCPMMQKRICGLRRASIFGRKWHGIGKCIAEGKKHHQWTNMGFS